MIEAVTDRLEGAPQQFRRWSDEFKAQAIEASMEPGANVSAVARRIGVDPSRLFIWRRNAHLKDAALVDVVRRSEKQSKIIGAVLDEQGAFVFEEINTGIAAIEALVGKGRDPSAAKRAPRPRKGFPSMLANRRS